MIFGIASVWSPHETAYGQIDAGRAVLPLVVAIGSEVHDLEVVSAVPNHMFNRAIDLRISAAASLVSEGSRISDARQERAHA